MSDVGRFGVFLPSYVWAGDGPERAGGIKDFARTVEDLGFDSLFITDHLLVGKRFYSVNWLEPLLSLAVAAGVTERVRLGTSILIMPLRNPVLLAKELATLQFLSDNRVVLGAGVGWNDVEYEAVGVHSPSVGGRPTRCSTSCCRSSRARPSPTTASTTRSTTCSSSLEPGSGPRCGSAAARSWRTR